jgi:hypothetical protein
MQLIARMLVSSQQGVIQQHPLQRQKSANPKHRTGNLEHAQIQITRSMNVSC